MPQYLRPGVFIEEIAGPQRKVAYQPRPPGDLAGQPRVRWRAGSSAPVFLGLAERGPVGSPTVVTNWDQFEMTFGSEIEDGYLAAAVYGYLQNGGHHCWVVRLCEHADPSLLTLDDFDHREPVGLRALETRDDVSFVCAPDIMAAYARGGLDHEGVQAAQLALIAHCEYAPDYRIALLDPPPGLDVGAMVGWRSEIAAYDTKCAALYYPWIRVWSGMAQRFVFVPPSGHVAGVHARAELMHGPHRGVMNASIKTAFDLETSLLVTELDALVLHGINPLMSSPSAASSSLAHARFRAIRMAACCGFSA
jgi:hypothetical protein